MPPHRPPHLLVVAVPPRGGGRRVAAGRLAAGRLAAGRLAGRWMAVRWAASFAVAVMLGGCGAAQAGRLPAVPAPPASTSAGVTVAGVTGSPPAKRSGPEPMSAQPLAPLPESRPTTLAQRRELSVAVARHYLTAAVLAIRGGDPGPLDAVAGRACGCRSVVAAAQRLRPLGGVPEFDVLLASAAETDGLGMDVSVVSADYTIPAHTEPAPAGGTATPVPARRFAAEIFVRWTGPAPVVDRIRVVRSWPA